MKKALGGCLTVVGFLAIIFAVVCWTMNVSFGEGTSVAQHTYGGDAYTGIQNAAAETANNIQTLNRNISELADVISNCMGYLLFTMGVTLFLIGAVMILKGEEKVTTFVTTVPQTASNAKRCSLCGRPVSQYDANCPYCGGKM